MSVTGDHIQTLRDLLLSRAGYALTAERASLAENRLGPLARREGFTSAAELIGQLATSRASLGWEVVEAMLPADSQFFRERETFRVLDELLPALSAARPGGRVRVLSAGCGTGQEVWSTAITAAEAGLNAVEILGVDLAVRGLEKGRDGLYSQFEVQRGLRARQLIRWLEPAGDDWRVRDDLRQGVRFDRANLIDGLEGRESFDLILCRHVLGDMSPQARRRVLAGLDSALARDGCLFVGARELVPEALEAFRPVAGRSGLYVKNPARLSQAA
ncbi:protein-glutamate O-methyltransferase CheR [Brevundimonas sp.]|uniref:CheR family methyltransferase n=1 Tax=Brevundimonas sp. TaxID=1871086 RepID=UPI0025DB4017|nr:protein-glutamate O-methyltransferase CheR [Brevundimonas sp.]